MDERGEDCREREKEKEREERILQEHGCEIELSCAFVAITWEIGSSRYDGMIVRKR